MFISWLIASICFGQPGAAVRNMPSGWFTTVASCVWLALPHRPTSQETNSTCWWNLESPSYKHTIWSFLYISRCDCAVPLVTLGGLEFVPSLIFQRIHAEVYQKWFVWNLVDYINAAGNQIKRNCLLLAKLEHFTKCDGRTPGQMFREHNRQSWHQELTPHKHISPSQSARSSPPV